MEHKSIVKWKDTFQTAKYLESEREYAITQRNIQIHRVTAATNNKQTTKNTRTNNDKKRKAEIEIQVKFLWAVRRFMHYIFLIYINIESVIHGTQVAQAREIRQSQQQQQQQQRVNDGMEIENENAKNIVLSHSSSTRMSSYIFTYYIKTVD